MSIHPDGSGTGWTNVEAVDVDQPHGKDYLYSQHIAKGVRKRMNQEHSAFADATVGGIHKPGGAAVLGIEDGTATILADGTLKGHGIVWDNTARLWCSTAAAGASTTGNFALVKLHPDKQWAGGDVTWAGQHDFNAPVCFSAVDISDSLDLTGALACGSTATITNLLTCSSNATVSGKISIAEASFDGVGDFSLADGTEAGAPVHYAQNKVIQVVNTQTGAVATGNTLMPYNDTIPQITEGDEYMTLAITPTSATNKLKIDVVFFYNIAAVKDVAVALFQDATAGALAVGARQESGYQYICCIAFSHYMNAGTTSATTFRVRAGNSPATATTITFNGEGGARKYGGVLASSITITEINTL